MLSFHVREKEREEPALFQEMSSKVVRLSSSLLSSAVSLAGERLMAGGVLAVPTDTIYGLTCLVQHQAAVESLYDIKGRHSSKPIAICVAEVEEIYTWAEVTVERTLIEQLLPGQVTLVFRRGKKLNRNFNPDSQLIGVRIPDYPFLREVCRLCQSPLALTSANYSNMTSSLAVEEFQELHSSLSLVFDGGRLSDSEEARLGSTVVDLSEEGSYSIIRPGSARHTVTSVMEQHGIKLR